MASPPETSDSARSVTAADRDGAHPSPQPGPHRTTGAVAVHGAPHATAVSALLGVVAALVGTLAGLVSNPWLLVLPGALGGLWATTAFYRTDVAGLQIRRAGPVRTSAGGPVRHRIEWVNSGTRALAPLRATVRLPGIADQVVDVPALEPGAVAGCDLDGTAPLRGVYHGGDLQIVTQDPLGLTRRHRAVMLPIVLSVHPSVAAPYPEALITAPGSGGPRLIHGAAPDLAGLRAWRRGDELRDVHRRASARRGYPIVVERDEPVGTRRFFVLAGPLVTDGDEHALARATATCLHLWSSGSCASLACWSAQTGTILTSPGSGATALLDWCAALPRLTVPTPAQVVASAAAEDGRPGPGAMDVLVTSGTPPTWEVDLTQMCAGTGVELRVRRPEPVPGAQP